MSFGFSSLNAHDYNLIEQAIKHAYSRSVLIFTATSNSSTNQQRTFPARHNSVIYIHSTTTDNLPSRFNLPLSNHNNFATTREAIESS